MTARLDLEGSSNFDGLQIYEYRGREAISQLFEYEVFCIYPGGALRASDLVGERVSLVFRDGDEELRRVHGVVAEAIDLLDTEPDHTSYRLVVRPRFWRSSLVEILDIHLDMSIPDIIRHKLEMTGLALDHDFELRLWETYPDREFVVQFQENDHAFISRLCEHVGIAYFFEEKDGADHLVFSDSNDVFKGPRGDATEIAFHSRGEHQGIFELQQINRMVPAVFVQRDYNYRTPDIDLTANAELPGGHAGAIYEYGGHFKTDDEGRKLALVRAQERDTTRTVFKGKSNEARLRSGSRVDVTGHPKGDLALVITAVEHRGKQGFAAKEDAPRYVNQFEAIPAGVVFRPPRVTPKPRVGGLLTGIVEGRDGSEYADVDDQGRYRVRFLFDTAARGERQASRPVRMMQPHAGPGYGMHFPLRAGVEVLIAFVGGDPDRPIIAGTIPNPRTQSPVVADNRERNIIRTGGGNEINIDDTGGNQRIKLSSPRSNAVLQLGAPNAPEDGASVTAFTNVTQAGGASVNTLSTVTSTWSAWNNTFGNHVTSVAGAVTPMQWFEGWASTAAAALGMVSSFAGIYPDIKDKELDIARGEENVAHKKNVYLDDEAQRQEDRDALLAEIDALLDPQNPPSPPLSDAEKEQLEALKAAMKAYDDRVAALHGDGSQPGALAELSALRDKRKTALDADDEDEAKRLKKLIEAKESEINTLRGGDQKEGSIAEAQAQIEAAIAAARTPPAGAGDTPPAGAGDTPAPATAARLGKLDAFAAQQKEAEKKRSKYDKSRERIEDLEWEVNNPEGAYAEAREVQDAVSSTQGIISGGVLPLYSVIATLVGNGLQGYARTTAELMRQEADRQKDGTELRIKAGKPQRSINPLTGFMTTPTVHPPEPRNNSTLGAISQLDWGLDALQMKPGGGAGIVGWLKGGAFGESRNIQGSEDFAVLYGRTATQVSGEDYAALTSTKKVLVTADEQTVVHSRGNVELAGVGRATVASAEEVELLTRGTFRLKVKDGIGNANMEDDHDVGEICFENCNFHVRNTDTRNKDGARLLMSGPSILLDAEHNQDGNAEISLVTYEDGTIRAAELALTEKKTAHLLAATWGLRATESGVTVGDPGWQLKIADEKVALGLASADDTAAQLQMTADAAALSAKDTVGILADNVLFHAKTVDFGKAEVNMENLMVKATKVDAKLTQLAASVQRAVTQAASARSKAEAALKAAKVEVKVKVKEKLD